MADQTNTFMIEGAQLIFRNFAGKEGKYNAAGDRNFSILLTDEIAAQLATDGWNVKLLAAQEEGDQDRPYIPVTVSYRSRPPKIVMMTSRARTFLTEETVEVLDWAELANVDVMLNPYQWVVGDKSGIKAYLKTMYATVEEDALERKYALEPEE